MKHSDLVRKACVTAYNMDYDQFLQVFKMHNDYYAKGKYQEMQKDFSSWYCSLDFSRAEQFIDYVLTK